VDNRSFRAHASGEGTADSGGRNDVEPGGVAGHSWNSAGDNTGYEWLEMPRYASIMVFFGYMAIGVGALTTFHQRRERQLYTSHWFLIAAVFWFPWIYSTANYLLVAKPVRGVLQAALDWWYMNNLSMVWFGCVGYRPIFYFIPKMTSIALQSWARHVCLWGMIIFGSWVALRQEHRCPHGCLL